MEESGWYKLTLTYRNMETLAARYPGESWDARMRQALQWCPEDYLPPPPPEEYVARPGVWEPGFTRLVFSTRVCLTGELHEKAQRLGEGNFAQGVRRAIATLAVDMKVNGGER